MKVLFISYGRGGLYENKAGVLDRHKTYAKHFDSIEIIYLTKKKLEYKDFGRLKITPIYGKSYLICLIKALFRDYRTFQIVTTQDPFLTAILGLFYKMKFGIKLHIQNHSNFIDNKFWIKENVFINSTLNFIAKKITIPQAHRLRVVNSYEKQMYIDKIGINEFLIDVAPISLNPVFFKKITKKEILNFQTKHKLNKNCFKIGWAGRFVRLKRLDYLFELSGLLAKKLDIQLILAGDYTVSDYNFKDLEKANNLNPIYTGLLSPGELAKFFKSIDVFVLTSEYEGYGMVLAESLKSHTRILISDKSKGTDDIIDNSDYAFKFSSSNDFVKKILEIKNLNKKLFKNSLKPPKISSVESIKKTIE